MIVPPLTQSLQDFCAHSFPGIASCLVRCCGLPFVFPDADLHDIQCTCAFPPIECHQLTFIGIPYLCGGGWCCNRPLRLWWVPRDGQHGEEGYGMPLARSFAYIYHTYSLVITAMFICNFKHTTCECLIFTVHVFPVMRSHDTTNSHRDHLRFHFRIFILLRKALSNE